jgi:hypothetical protein
LVCFRGFRGSIWGFSRARLVPASRFGCMFYYCSRIQASRSIGLLFGSHVGDSVASMSGFSILFPGFFRTLFARTVPVRGNLVRLFL